MIDTKTMTDRELGYHILRELIGGEPTVERIMYWYAQQQQKKRQQIHLVRDDDDPERSR
jgi:hypothetical protein